jgi:pantetheine hydrolase
MKLTAVLSFLPCAMSSYIAGVANHHVFFGSGSDQPEYLTNMNLQMYENLTAVAGKQGAQVLVFPEFGLEPIHDAARTDLYAYAETVPMVSDTLVIPCEDPDTFADRPILFRMSCAARRESVLVLVNMIDSQPCDRSADPNCPDDDRYQVMWRCSTCV